jgi:hypothetical protein
MLVLDFSNILDKSNQSPLYAHVLDVDNARETINVREPSGSQEQRVAK